MAATQRRAHCSFFYKLRPSSPSRFSTTIARRSLTFVPVGPVRRSAPASSKSGYASWRSRASRAASGSSVVASAIAPAASVGPSSPSVSALATTTRGRCGRGRRRPLLRPRLRPQRALRERQSRARGELRVRAARPRIRRVPERDGRLAAGEQHGRRLDRRPAGGALLGDRGVGRPRLARLASDARGQHQRLVPPVRRGGRRRVQRGSPVPDDERRAPVERRVARGRGLRQLSVGACTEALAHAVGGVEVVPVEDRQRVRVRRGSGTVGPLAIVSSGSPITSLTARGRTVVAGAAARANCPPFTAEQCFRTALISSIDAPDVSSADVSARRSPTEMGSAGAASSALPPPVMTARTRSSGPARSAASRTRRALSTPRSLGSG